MYKLHLPHKSDIGMPLVEATQGATSPKIKKIGSYFIFLFHKSFLKINNFVFNVINY